MGLAVGLLDVGTTVFGSLGMDDGIWFEQGEPGVFIWRARLIAQDGVVANRVSVSGDSVASMSVVMTACQAVRGAAACRCSADGFPFSVGGETVVRWLPSNKLPPKGHHFGVEALGLRLWNEGHAQGVLAGWVLSLALLSSRKMAEIFGKRRVAVLMVGGWPSTKGPRSLSPGLSEMSAQAISALIWPYPGIRAGWGSVHDAVQIWILLGCSSTLMALVAREICSMGAGMSSGLSHMCQSYK